MVHEIKQWWWIYYAVLVVVVSCNIHWVAVDGSQVPCFFIFGDSLADNGNNNNLVTSAKVNYYPYGIDYAGGNTGRFTNGRNVVDFLAEYLGFKHHIPSFASANGQTILHGVNYASGSAGIRDETGQHLGQNINLHKQLQNHNTTISRMVEILGYDAAQARLKKCLYTVGMGSNDYINNYFMPEYYTSSKVHTPGAYARALVDRYSTQLMTLYNSGARKVAVGGLGYLGCIPFILDRYAKGTSGSNVCAGDVNQAASLFNHELALLVQRLNTDLHDAKFIFLNNTGMGEGHPAKLGSFTNTRTGCCNVRKDGQCIADQEVCSNRAKYVFWDSFHPTEAANVMTAARTYTAYAPTDSHPFDIRTLATLELATSKI